MTASQSGGTFGHMAEGLALPTFGHRVQGLIQEYNYGGDTKLKAKPHDL